MDARLRTALVFGTALVAAISVTVGAQKPKTDSKKKSGPAKPVNLVWPLPPEQPRIRFVTMHRGEIDFDKKKESRFKTLLLGPEAPTPMHVLVKPYGVAVGKSGRVYVTDTVQRKVFVIDPAAKSVTFVGNEGQGKVQKPIGVAVDDDDRVFVADATLNRIFGYGPDGELIIAMGSEGELENPSGLALDRQKHLLYVADSKRHKVLVYSSEDGKAIREIGERGLEEGKFNFPTNLFVDRESRLYVADTMNFRVQIFDADGKFLRALGTLGDGPGNLARPKGVAVDSEGHIYIADSNFHNYQIFDSEGRLLLYVGIAGRGPGEFLLPAGMAVDDQDRIYVADQGNSRVQVFQYPEKPRQVTRPPGFWTVGFAPAP